jgi:hypothetical protein
MNLLAKYKDIWPISVVAACQMIKKYKLDSISKETRQIQP